MKISSIVTEAYHWLILLSTAMLILVGSNALALSASADTAAANSAPSNPKPTETTAATYYTLPDSHTHLGFDICGNPKGTRYAEGQNCPSYEKIEGPYITYKSPWEKLLVFTAATLAVAFALIYAAFYKFGRGGSEEWAARYLVIILVIGSSIFILAAGYDDKQAAPLFGLFGTLIGYLFGRAPPEGLSAQASTNTPVPPSNKAEESKTDETKATGT